MTTIIDLSALGTAGFIIQGDIAGDYAGFSVSSAGDVNGDGFGDVIVGATGGDDGGARAGEAYVVFGKAGGFDTVDLSDLPSQTGFIIRGDAASDVAGSSVSSAGDVNGDGYDDVIVGAPFGDDGGIDAGEAYVIFGKAGGFGTIDLGDLAAADGLIIQGGPAGDTAGCSVAAAGDVNNDGIDDLIVGAFRGDDGGINAGEAFVIFGRTDGFDEIDLTALAPGAGFSIRGDLDYDYAGVSVSSAGDVNGDGFGDVIVGARTGDDGGHAAGEAYVVFGKADGFDTVELAGLAPEQGFIVQGGIPDDNLGRSVSSAGDFNGDGFADIIVGAPRADDGADRGGNAYVIFGKASGFGTIAVGDLSPQEGFLLSGGSLRFYAGYSVSSAGDVNGDGFDDVMIGTNANNVAIPTAGLTYVVFGKAAGFSKVDLSDLAPADGFVIEGDAASDKAGFSVSEAGDVNGDGFDDLIVGAPYGGDGGVKAGEAYVIFGTAPTTSVTRIGSVIGQTIRGGGGDDLLDGRDGDDGLFGAGGDDALFGGAGHDTLNGGDGDDNLSGGSGNDAIEGGAGIDTLSGGSGNDMLDGGAGGDALSGGSGNDRYIVDRRGDRVNEFEGGGSDRILARVNYILAEGVEVEALSTGANAGTAAINLTGNEIANRITGNNGINTLSGRDGADTLSGLGGADRLFGGSGNDVLTGGTGADRFSFDTALHSAANVDRITDFVAVDDIIVLDLAIFGGIAVGVLAAAAFCGGTAAQDDSDRIIYDAASGNIFHDSDGTGAAAQVLFARVDPGTALGRADFTAFTASASAASAPASSPRALQREAPDETYIMNHAPAPTPGHLEWMDLLVP